MRIKSKALTLETDHQFKSGHKVHIAHPKTPYHNTVGTIHSYDWESEKYFVVCDLDGKKMRINPKDLTLAEDEDH